MTPRSLRFLSRESVIGNPTFSDPDPSADYAERRNEIRRAEINRILDSILN